MRVRQYTLIGDPLTRVGVKPKYEVIDKTFDEAGAFKRREAELLNYRDVLVLVDINVEDRLEVLNKESLPLGATP